MVKSRYYLRQDLQNEAFATCLALHLQFFNQLSFAKQRVVELLLVQQEAKTHCQMA